MATTPNPIVMEFEKDAEKNYTSTRHFNLTKGATLFSEKLNISDNRGFSKAKYKYCLKIRKNGKWSPQITGLFPTHDPDLFYGDTQNKKHLLMARFFQNGTKLRLYLYRNFYPRGLTDFPKGV